MDERLKNIVDNLENMQIGLDEQFKFHCTQCGKCCIHREDILLNPKDVYGMAKELGIEPKDFIDRYCEIYIGSDSKNPVVRLKPKGSVKRCPLLKDRKCMVHKAKPTVCAMFPLGRCLIVGGAEENADTAGSIQYIFNHPGCGDRSETHTVREWIESFGIPVEDEFFFKWQEIVVLMSITFREAADRMNESSLNILWSAALVTLYLYYDVEKEFLPQFEDNAREFEKLLNKCFPDGK